MLNPCELCKRTSCPDVCYPQIDYERAMRKRYGKCKTKTTVQGVPGSESRLPQPVR